MNGTVTATISEYSDYIAFRAIKQILCSRKKKVRGFLRKQRQEQQLRQWVGNIEWVGYLPSAGLLPEGRHL